jgi:putative oxidoreductase
MSEYVSDLQTLSIGILIARLSFGLLMAAHGAQKLFGWFGGYGLHNTGEFMVQLGFRPGRAFAAAAGLGEITGGILVALGFLGPIGPALMVSVMIVAMITVHWRNGIFAANNGVELPLLYFVGAIVFALAGYGVYSLDAWLGLAGRWPETLTWIVLVAAIAAGLVNIALRNRQRPEQHGV